ncbi:hypothetical protein GCM10010278_09580 [Streptomyces melanogenes]|nr:hypothetical protein GCM10010278_09580 [Streptomyces melanogenes]
MLLRRYHEHPDEDPAPETEPDEDAPQPPAAGRSPSRRKPGKEG